VPKCLFPNSDFLHDTEWSPKTSTGPPHRCHRLPFAVSLQFLAHAEPKFDCDRQLVVPLATEAGLLDALNARLPPPLEPLASWTRTGIEELPDGDVRRLHWWSSRVTQVKAAALLEAATGRDVPGWRQSGRARRVECCRPPQRRARGSASQGSTIPRHSSGTCSCPCYQRIVRRAGQPAAALATRQGELHPCRGRDGRAHHLVHVTRRITVTLPRRPPCGAVVGCAGRTAPSLA